MRPIFEAWLRLSRIWAHDNLDPEHRRNDTCHLMPSTARVPIIQISSSTTRGRTIRTWTSTTRPASDMMQMPRSSRHSCTTRQPDELLRRKPLRTAALTPQQPTTRPRPRQPPRAGDPRRRNAASASKPRLTQWTVRSPTPRIRGDARYVVISRRDVNRQVGVLVNQRAVYR